MDSDLQNQILSNIAEEMRKDIDFGAWANTLTDAGWYRVDISRLIDNKHAIDMRIWAESNCQWDFKHEGCTWVFQSESDAMWFKLKWQR